MELIDDPDPGLNQPEFSVSEISGAIKRVIEGEFSHVRVKGEIGRVSFPRSGHIYLDIKDERAVLAAVIWKGIAARLRTPPEEGLEIVATGRVTTFGGHSKYQLIIDDIRPAGVGALMAMLEKRKAMLAAEGLFEQSRKKPIPYLPEVIGVITSPSGAVIRDILHRLRDRFPRKVLLWPVAVQGDKCASEVSQAIDGFNAIPGSERCPRPDTLIVARGGGSLEDLWGFNDETVVRAAANSKLPLISAVGHETDNTLIDLVSDLRAPTPSAAAELAVPVRLELCASLSKYVARASRALNMTFERRWQRLQDLARALPKSDTLFAHDHQKLDHLIESLPKSLFMRIQISKLRFFNAGGLLRPFAARSKYELASKNFEQLWVRLDKALERFIYLQNNDLTKLSSRLIPNLVVRKMKDSQESFIYRNKLLLRVADLQIAGRYEQLATLDRLREMLGYKETLNRGYAVVRSGKKVIKSVSSAEIAAKLEVEFQDGRFSIELQKKVVSQTKSSDQGDFF